MEGFDLKGFDALKGVANLADGFESLEMGLLKLLFGWVGAEAVAAWHLRSSGMVDEAIDAVVEGEVSFPLGVGDVREFGFQHPPQFMEARVGLEEAGVTPTQGVDLEGLCGAARAVTDEVNDSGAATDEVVEMFQERTAAGLREVLLDFDFAIGGAQAVGEHLAIVAEFAGDRA